MIENDNDKLSRRGMLRVSAMAGGAVAVAACGGSSTPTDVQGTDAVADGNASGQDIQTLNALLSAEYNAIKAYDAGAAILASPPPGDAAAPLAPTLLMIAARFQSQHRDHAAALAMTISGAGGTPVAESSISFTAPPGFTPGVINVLKLACNAEKAAAVAYNGAVAALTAGGNRFLAMAIQGDETQHFIALYVILKGTAEPGPNLGSMVSAVVPTSFVSTVGASMGLQSVADFTYA